MKVEEAKKVPETTTGMIGWRAQNRLYFTLSSSARGKKSIHKTFGCGQDAFY